MMEPCEEELPSTIPLALGVDVSTIYGRGKVTEIREEDDKAVVVVVRVTDWRLAGRSSVICYLQVDAIQVVPQKKLFEMTVYEKVEHAQSLKEKASAKFSAKKYQEALQLYAQAVDAVRYVQHTKDSTNELRADLLLVMITCCNNAATCCIQLKEWDRAYKFGTNGLVLLDALFDKRGSSRILTLLNREGISESKLFGAWKVKSLLVISRGLMQSHKTSEAIENLKKALEMISFYKKANDGMFRQLQGQEREVHKLLNTCRENLKSERRKEKQRAKAMFGGMETTKAHGDKEVFRTSSNGSICEEKGQVQGVTSSTPQKNEPADGKVSPRSSKPNAVKKSVTFADGTTPGSYDDNAIPSFFEEHKEALLIVGSIALGSMCVQLFFRNRR